MNFMFVDIRLFGLAVTDERATQN